METLSVYSIEKYKAGVILKIALVPQSVAYFNGTAGSFSADTVRGRHVIVDVLDGSGRFFTCKDRAVAAAKKRILFDVAHLEARVRGLKRADQMFDAM